MTSRFMGENTYHSGGGAQSSGDSETMERRGRRDRTRGAGYPPGAGARRETGCRPRRRQRGRSAARGAAVRVRPHRLRSRGGALQTQVKEFSLDRCLARIERWQPRINAFVHIDSNPPGGKTGPLSGLSLAHKDMFYRAGKVSNCGSKIRRGWVAAETSTALERLDAAGALQIGTLNMSEFAYGPTGHNDHWGDCCNPWNPDYITGGSSSGSGAADAARLVFGALGSDTGGSVRIPAAACGVTGLKTTWGRVSRHGAMPLSHSLDTVGPLARSAEDCALLLGLMAGADPEDLTASSAPVPDYMAATAASIKGLKIGVPTSFYVDDLDPEVARILDETVAVLKREGADIVKVELPDQRQLSAASQLVLAVEAAAFHKRWLIERPQDYGPQVLMRLQNGLAIPGVTYLEALRWRGAALAAYLAATRGVDAVIAPVAPIPAPTIAESDVGNTPGAEAVIQRLTRFTRPVNYLGLPSLAIPSGFAKGGLEAGLPVAMQLIGRSFDEATLLTIGAAFQRATDFH